MMAWSLSELARCGGGELVGNDQTFESVSTDTRTLEAGALYVALSGSNFDGHDFVEAAAERGAVAVLVSRTLPVTIPQVVVSDTLAALSAFAREWRREFSIPVIGVTGSNGKTTTKELIGSILSGLGLTLITRGNLNNHIGVPLTLLQLRREHRYAVIEMGANHQGEIAHLMSLAEPTIGIVTNAGAAHLEGFGSLEGVAQGKGEMFRNLPASGVAIINADDAFATLWIENRAAERVLTFGFEQPAQFTAHKVKSETTAHGFRTEFELVTPEGTRPASLALAGLHNLRNALGAAAVAYAAGASLDDVVRGLATMKTVAGRLELKPAIKGAYLVDDSYNANPSSLKAGLDTFRSFGGTRWLVLGEMKELGDSADALHGEVGRYAREAGVARLLAVGEGSKHAVDAFGEGAQWFDNLDSLIDEARSSLVSGIAVLIKGSRANKLEKVAAALAANPTQSEGH